MTNQPPLTIGEKVVWCGGSFLGSKVIIKQGIYHGKVCWVGKLQELGSFWIVGIEMEKALKGAGDGAWETRHIFTSRAGHGLFLPATNVIRQAEFNLHSDKITGSPVVMKQHCKKGNKCLADETTSHPTPQNGPVNLKLSPLKGATNSTKNTQFSSSQSNASVELRKTHEDVGSNSPQEGKTTCFRRGMFNSLGRKEQDSFLPLAQESFLHEHGQTKSSKTGLFNMFKWFSRKQTGKRKTDSVEQLSGKDPGSSTSLASDSNSINFYPIRHSVSADNSKAMMEIFNKGMPQDGTPGIQVSKEDGHCRRSSLVSLRSNTSLTSFGSRGKKRMAPQPPAVNKLWTTTSASDLNFGASSENKQPFKSENDGILYGKIKRKAPLPPAIKDKSSLAAKGSTTFSPFPPDNSMRPISTFSSFSSVSLSGSSTLKSSTCSENDSSTMKSDSSPNTTPSSLCSEGKGPLSPRPWYKRKKNKSKDKESKSTKKDKNIVYELCMPDIQYARKTVNLDSPNSSESRNIEAFYDRTPQNGQRFSILSSISDLDRAATEQLEREKAQKKASKIILDQSFYNVSPPHMLRQDDLISRPQSPQGAKSLVSVNQTEMAYDNLHYNDHESRSTTDASYCKQPALKLTDKSTPKLSGKFSSNSTELTYVDDPPLIPEIYNQSDISGKINYEEYIEQIRQELEDDSLNSLQSTASKCTPMQKAIFDPELFYQLAKDAKINGESKISTVTKNIKENTTKPKIKEKNEAGASSFDCNPPSCPPPKTFLKNFGLRMNNFYTPDVSTILEGSESVTSSTTTPADDMIEEGCNRSLLSLDKTTSMMSLNSEYRMNLGEFQELAENLSLDLNQGDDGDRGKQGAVSYIGKQTKVDQVREETLFMRERENFLLWQKTMQETELTREDDANSIEERKKKWICNTCTLINQPWRLHCGACGSLRPPNPRRIDSGDFKPNLADMVSSCHMPSIDSPIISVIQGERNAADLNNENTSESGGIQNSQFRNSEMEAVSNMNWESELQSYFTLFDDHANAIKKIESSSNKIHPSEESSERDEKSVYGKINVSKNKKLVVNNQGAKPKELIPNRGEPEDMDLREIRRARIKKFQLNYSSSKEQQNDCANLFPYMNERPPGIGSGVKEKIEMLSELTSPESKVKSICSADKPNLSNINESFNFFQKSEERKSIRKEPKKSQVLKPSGAVKSVISIFNQLDQLKSVQEKIPPVKSNRRKSVTNILNLNHFERLISGISNESTERSIPLSHNNSPVMNDIDIASAISKFDEMAAFAEIDCLRKPVPKAQKKSFKSEIVFNNKSNVNERDVTNRSGATHGLKNGSPDNALTASCHSTYEASKPIQLRNKINNRNGDRDSCDSIIKDGILYTSGESRRTSISIGSGTFELIAAKDFASIEAHHSRKPSPVNDIDVLLPSELSHPLLMPEISNPISSNVNTNERVSKDMNTAQEEWLTHNSKNAFEQLSRQLKEADGIATFKATLEEDKPELGESNTKTITRLLKRLEAAISSEQHAEASRLAHDLAKLRLSFSPYKKSNEINSPFLSQHNATTKSPRVGDANSVHNNSELLKDRNSQVNEPIHYPDSSMMNGAPSTGVVVKRGTKVDPVRREVKSDITNWSLEKDSPPLEEDKPFNVKMYVEDKASHQGPILLLLQPNMTVGDLKLKVSEEFGFPLEVQRWILGRLLADDDFKTLAFHKVTAEGCPIFLYLVAPEFSESTVTSPVISRSSSIRSHPPNELEAAEKSKVDKEIHSSKSIDFGGSAPPTNYEEKTREHVKPKQNVKQTKKNNEAGGRKKSSKFTVSGLKFSQQPNNGGDEPPSSLSKGHKPKASKMKANKNVSEIQVNVDLDSPRVMMEPEVDRIAKLQLLKPPNDAELKDGTNANRNRDQSINSDQAPDIDGWICPQCTLVNAKDRPGCEACATERPDVTYASNSKSNLRQAVTALDAHGCVPNLEPFDCMVCFVRFQEMEGAILRDCLHVFCRECLSNTVKYSETAEVKCPFSNKSYSCQFSLQEREIKDLLSEEDYKRHLDKSVKEAAGSMRNVFYCKTPDCKGFCQYEDNVNVFTCDVCRKSNCLTCQAQHEGVTCREYQDDLAQKEDEEALKTKQFFDDIIRRGDGIMCPQCSVMLVRKWGCDWMRCPMCRTEICWVTRGPRWGPEGQGDTSGGCKCGLNGRKCHPKCTYCH